MTLYIIEKFNEERGVFVPTCNVHRDAEKLSKVLAFLNEKAPGVTRRIQPYTAQEGVIRRPPKVGLPGV